MDWTTDPLMAPRGRWARDADGWNSRRDRSSSRGRGRGRQWDEQRGGQWQDANQKLREQNQRLQQQLREARSLDGATAVSSPHPKAREGPQREGDWLCVHCGFGTNRHARQQCYRCAAARSLSFPQGRTAPAASGVVDFSMPNPAVGGNLGAAISIASSLPSPITSPSSALPSAGPPTTPTTTTSTSAATSTVGSAAVAGPVGVAAAVGQAPGHIANGSTGSAVPALVGPEAIKALKGQLDRLVSAKATIAADPLLGHVAAGLEHQIQGVRNQLASAQPLEVALRGTLGAVSAARQALTRAEQKASKLEAQVVAAVSAYDLASAEVQACQKALADAEAATARTAGGRFDPRLLIGSHPGAALAVLSEAAAARCVVGAAGVDAALAARVQAAFAEVQQVCRLLPADVPQPRQPDPVASVATEVSGEPATVQGGGVPRGGISGTSHLGAPQGGPSAEAPLPAEQGGTHAQLDAAHAAHVQVLAQQQAAHFAAAELARQHANAAMEQATVQVAQQVATAAAAPSTAVAANLPQPEPSSEPAAAAPGEPAQEPRLDQTTDSALGVGIAGPAQVGAEPGGGGGSAKEANGRSRDDEMGGAAANHVVNKRAASEALESARVIAAKAKARAA